MGLLSDNGIVLAVKSVVDIISNLVSSYTSLPSQNITTLLILALCLFLSYSLVKLIPSAGENNGIKLLGGILLFWLVQ
jgi:hypothetical protein